MSPIIEKHTPHLSSDLTVLCRYVIPQVREAGRANMSLIGIRLQGRTLY